jgi:NitT/TauT family transport system substrate-binding protein
MKNKAILYWASALLTFCCTAAVAQVPVRIGFIPVLGTSQIFVADQLGMLKAAGLTPRFTNFESGPVMIQALASGTLEVYVGGVAPLAVARSKGVEVKVVTATAIEEMTVTIGGKFAPYFKQGTSSAEAFKAFHAATGKAARMATQPPGSVPHTTLVHWLDEVAHVPKADYEIITMGIDATQQALLAGAVDGSTLREPAITVSEQRDPRIKVVAYGAEMFKDQPGTVVAVSGAFLAKNREGVQKLVDAIVEATGIIQKEPKKAVPAIEAALGKSIIDEATILKSLSSPASKFTADPRVIIDSTREMQAYQVKIGTLDKEYPLEGLFDPSFYVKAAAGK